MERQRNTPDPQLIQGDILQADESELPSVTEIQESATPQEPVKESAPYDPMEKEFEITISEIILKGLKLGGRRCLLAEAMESRRRVSGEPIHWGKNYNGYVERKDAISILVDDACKYLGGGQYILEILKEPAPPAGNKSLITDHFSENFIELIRLSPNNPVVRSQIMRQLLKEPPKSAETYDQIKDWVEKTFERKPALEASKNKSPGFKIIVELGRTEYGRASYSCRQVSLEEVELGIDDISEMIENGNSVEGIMDHIKAAAANHEDIYYENVGDISYRNSESEDSDHHTQKITNQREEIRRLYQFIKENIGEEALEELEINS